MDSKMTGRKQDEPSGEVLRKLDERISRIEKRLNLQPIENSPQILESAATKVQEGESLELQIGLYWFAKVGIVALITGVTFLILQPYQGLNPLFAPALGYVSAGAVLLCFRYLSKPSPFLAGYLLGGGILLAFIATLRLHFLTDRPALPGSEGEILLLLLVFFACLLVSLSRKSPYLAAVSLSIGCTTALLSDGTYPYFTIIGLMALLTVYLAMKYEWHNLVVYGIALTYPAHLLWFINDPLLGNPLQLRSTSILSTLVVLGWIIIFATASYMHGKDVKEDSITLLSSLLNCFGGYGLYFLITITKFQDRLTSLHLVASGVFIILAAIYWTRRESRFRTFFYAMTGYAALSVAIVAGFKTPDFFIWLCWQSLLVVSTAVWFKSKFIVVANFFIYAAIFIAYLALAGTVSVTSVSFGVVALLSARILKWQRSRLDLKTEMMRNAYLIAAFFIIPYALYNAVPTGYVALTWVCVAVVYYAISLILKNTKYRWMALLTFLATAVYLLVIGTTKLEPVFRIVSFLVLGVVLLVVSFVYARIKTQSSGRKE